MRKRTFLLFIRGFKGSLSFAIHSSVGDFSLQQFLGSLHDMQTIRNIPLKFESVLLQDVVLRTSTVKYIIHRQRHTVFLIRTRKSDLHLNYSCFSSQILIGLLSQSEKMFLNFRYFWRLSVVNVRGSPRTLPNT